MIILAVNMNENIASKLLLRLNENENLVKYIYIILTKEATVPPSCFLLAYKSESHEIPVQSSDKGEFYTFVVLIYLLEIREKLTVWVRVKVRPNP